MHWNKYICRFTCTWIFEFLPLIQQIDATLCGEWLRGDAHTHWYSDETSGINLGNICGARHWTELGHKYDKHFNSYAIFLSLQILFRKGTVRYFREVSLFSIHLMRRYGLDKRWAILIRDRRATPEKMVEVFLLKINFINTSLLNLNAYQLW